MRAGNLEIAKEYMQKLLSEKGLTTLDYTMKAYPPEIVLIGNEQMIPPRQIMEMMESQELSIDLGIVNNEKVIMSDDKLDKILTDYWSNYRASMQAGNGIEIMIDQDISILTSSTSQYLESVGSNTMWIDTLGDIGNDEAAMIRNDGFLKNVGYVLLYTVREALIKTHREF
jgi:hypothetical protein